MAQQSLATRQRTAFSSLSSPRVFPPGLGTLTWDHLAPFQRRTSLRVAPLVAESKLPTAQQLFAEVQKTPLRALRLPGPTTPVTPCGSAGVPDLPIPVLVDWLPRCASS